MEQVKASTPASIVSDLRFLIDLSKVKDPGKMLGPK